MEDVIDTIDSTIPYLNKVGLSSVGFRDFENGWMDALPFRRRFIRAYSRDHSPSSRAARACAGEAGRLHAQASSDWVTQHGQSSDLISFLGCSGDKNGSSGLSEVMHVCMLWACTI